jgi:P-type E1-E2 ATPase
VFHHYADAFVIIGVIVVNTVVGYYMEGKAENTTQRLKEMMSPTAMVLRDEERVIIQSVDLTMGDVFYLQPGDIVPADGRVIQAVDLTVLEAALTGESHAVLKVSPPVDPITPLAERTSMVYSGTQILKGTASCIVVATGSKCEIGKISGLLTEVVDLKTPLTLELERFGRLLSVAIVTVALAALGAAFGRGYSVDDSFAFAIGIAVAAIPEGLPSCVTITFAIGVYKMALKRAVVKSLPAVETLGSVSVICSDKTGTLTINKMTVKSICTREKIIQVRILAVQ